MKKLIVANTNNSQSRTKSVILNWFACKRLAVQIRNHKLGEDADDRADEVDVQSYSLRELTENIPVLLYIGYGLEDGEDYQIVNNTSIIIRDSSNPVWEDVLNALEDRRR